MNGTDPTADRVLVLGGGMAGVACAQKLGDEGIDVVLVDRNDYHQFQPLLYQVASSQLPAEDIARPHRVIFADYPTVTLVTAHVSAVKLSPAQPGAVGRTDPDRLSPGAGRGCPAELLRCARGSRARLPAVLGGRRRAAALTPAASAAGGHGRATVRAEPGALDVVVVGGGPTGVETTGALAELMQALQSTGRLDPAGKITIVDRSSTLLGQFSSKAHDYALRKLTEVGADVKLEVGVTAVHPDRVEFDDKTTIPARTVVWGGGESGSAVAQTAGPVLGRGGRVDVRPDLTVEGYPGVYAVGDVANIPSGDQDAPTLPQLGSVAQQSGRWAAENILRELGHRPTKPFRYKDKGIMAMIGRNAAIAEVGKHRHQVEGPLAFAAWLGVHAMLLSGTHSKADAFLTWAWDYFDRDHAATVEASSVPQRIAWGDDDQDIPHISLDRPQPADSPAAT